MTINDLLEMLDLEEAAQFEYFENISDLIETDEDINEDLLFQLFKDVNMETMAELVNNYFDDVLEAVPDDAMEVYTLLDSIKLSFMGMAKNIEDDTDTVRFAELFYRFREWYSIESEVEVKDQSTGEASYMTIRDALTQARIEKLGGAKYDYSFDGAMDFEMDDYVMSFADLVKEEAPDYDPALDELDGMDIEGLEYTDQIFTPEE